MRALIFLMINFVGFNVYAQNEVKLSELSVPTSPGLILADKAPASIEKPTSPKAFAISLLSLRQGGAIETTPYWLVNHSAYTFDDYFKKKFPVIESFNISAATFKTDTTSVVSLGFKTQLVRLYSKSIRGDIDTKKKEIVEALSVEDFTPGDLEKIEKLKKEMASLKAKVTFNFEVAMAILGSSKSNSFKNLASDKSGIWTNIKFQPNKFPLDITVLVRYSWANNAAVKIGSDSSFLDYGASVSFSKTKFDLALEYVQRRDVSIDKSTNRLAFVVNYAVNDNIVIVGSFGKNYGKVDNIISLLGVKFGLSNEKVKL